MAFMPLLIGIFVIVGWMTHNPRLIQISPSFAPMQFNTAFLFILSAVAYFLMVSQNRLLSRFLNLLVLLFSVITFVQYPLDINLNIDQIFMPHYITVHTSHPGRMAPNTAICFFLLSLASFMIRNKEAKPFDAVATFLVSITFALGGIALMGYIFDIHVEYGWGEWTSMAVHTSVGIVFLSGALLIQRWVNRQSYFSIIIIMTIGSILSFQTFFLLNQSIENQNQNKFNEFAQQKIMLVHKYIEKKENELKAIHAFFRNSDNIDRNVFESFLKSLVDPDDKALFIWAPFHENLSYQPDYVFASGQLRELITKETFTDKIKLALKDQTLHASSETIAISSLVLFTSENFESHYGYYLFAPFNSDLTSSKPLGIILSYFMMQDVLAQSTDQKIKEGVSYYLFEKMDSQYEKQIFPLASKTMNYEEFSQEFESKHHHIYEQIINVYNKDWRVVVLDTDSEIFNEKSYVPFVAAILFLLLVLTISFNTYLLNRKSFEIQKAVRDKTSDLSMLNENLQIEVQQRKRIEKEMRLKAKDLETQRLAALNMMEDAQQAKEKLEASQLILRESEERFRSAFNTSVIGLALVGLDGKWLKVNKALCKTLGYTQEELLGTDFQSITHPADLKRDLDFLSQVLNGIIPYYTLEKRYFHKDGRVIWAILGVSIVRDANNKPLYFVSQIQDITLRKKTQDELKAQKEDLEKINLELDSFVYTASHDLRAPLRGISSFATFLEEDYRDKLDKEGQSYLTEIKKGSQRLSYLIDDLLTLSRISRIKNPYELVNIRALIKAVQERIEFDINELKVDLIIQKDLPDIICDRIKMAEVFVNLINNAIKFSSKRSKGQIKVEIGYEEQEKDHLFWVKDNGIGIDKKYQDQIFGMFKRLNKASEYDGTGAGLSIVKRVINDHHGRVWVKSEEGNGATFFFTIPKDLQIK